MARAAVWLLLFSILIRPSPTRAEPLVPNDDDEVVYLDSNLFIQIYDPTPASATLPLTWMSPTSGWLDLALGDVTGDGDVEIIAIRNEESGGRLVIFDPVAQDSPDDQVEEAGGIPWAILFELELEHAPQLVVAGEFDAERAGREILFSVALNDSTDRFVILRNTGEGLPGRNWEEQRRWDLPGRWTDVAAGNMFRDDPIDEVALVNFREGILALYRIEPEVVRVFERVNPENRWQGVAFGQYVIGDGDELGAVRDADLPLASAWVFRNDGGTVVDQQGERLSPSPKVVFFADIKGNGDDELVLLREVRPELGPRPRLVIFDGNNNDSLTTTTREIVLDGDNAYQGGTAGDLDGDGGEEIVLVRNNRIRVYTELEKSANFTLVERFTNALTVHAGNLDARGLAANSHIIATPSEVSITLLPGRRSSPRIVELVDATLGLNVPFTVRVEGAEGWLEAASIQNQTPTTLTVTVDSNGVQPGDYHAEVIVDFDTVEVENDPLVIPVTMRVRQVVTASPAGVDFTYLPCGESLLPGERTISLSSTEATSYSAQIEGNPAWITVAPEGGVLPEDVTLRVEPNLRPADNVAIDLLVTVDAVGEENLVNRIPITFVCTDYGSFLPIIFD